MKRKFEVTLEVMVDANSPIWPVDSPWAQADLATVSELAFDALYDSELEVSGDPEVTELT